MLTKDQRNQRKNIYSARETHQKETDSRKVINYSCMQGADGENVCRRERPNVCLPRWISSVCYEERPSWPCAGSSLPRHCYTTQCISPAGQRTINISSTAVVASPHHPPTIVPTPAPSTASCSSFVVRRVDLLHVRVIRPLCQQVLRVPAAELVRSRVALPVLLRLGSRRRRPCGLSFTGSVADAGQYLAQVRVLYSGSLRCPPSRLHSACFCAPVSYAKPPRLWSPGPRSSLRLAPVSAWCMIGSV